MATQVEGSFHNTSWQEDTIQDLGNGAKLTRARIGQDFSGGIEASGTWDSLMCYRVDGTADYVGYLRLVGRLGDRSGSAVLEANGTFDGSEARTTWSVVPGSGTDGWSGLRGTGNSAAPHGPDGSFAFDFEID